MIPFIFGYIPQGLVSIIGPAILVVIGFLSENHFVGRMPILANTVAVNIAYFGKDFNTLGSWQLPLMIYLDVGIIMGIISLISYAFGTKLDSLFYTAGWAYCSVAVGILLGLSLLVPYPLTI
jgi:hypothetical protein